MSRKVKLDAAMGVQVLEFLGKYQKLPERGIVAGQSVASALDAVFGRHDPVINDIDVFRRVRVDKKIGSDKVNNTASRHRISIHNFDEERQGYGQYAGMAQMLHLIQTYAIQSVSRDEMLNFVNCTTPGPEQPLTVSRVLAGFDLNCVRVGVDLESKQLIWDHHFERFMDTRQLEISMLHTPNHTMVRYLRKLKQIPGAYGNVEAAAEICAGVSKARYLRKLIEGHHVSVMFGKKLHEQAEEVTSDLRPYFDLEEHRFYKDDKSRTSSWKEVEVDGKLPEWSGPPEELTLWSLNGRGDLDPELQRRMDGLGAAVLTHGAKVVYDARRAKAKSVAIRFKEMRNVFEDKPKSAVAWNLRKFGEAYVEGHALEDIGHKVDAFLAKHTSFAGQLMGMTLGEQYEVIKSIRQVAREFDGEASLGVLELMTTQAELRQPELLRRLLREEAKESSKPFGVKPMQLPKLPAAFDGYVVRELLTKAALVREGMENHHCVGGYSSVVRSNRSRILSIRSKQGGDKSRRSTVEIRDGRFGSGEGAFGKGASLIIVQHRAFGNEKPHPMNEAVLEYVLTAYGKSPITAYLMRVSFGPKRLAAVSKVVRQIGNGLESMKKSLVSVQQRVSKANAFMARMSAAIDKADAESQKGHKPATEPFARDEPDGMEA